MSLYNLLILVLQIINPLMLMPGFWNYAYPYFFLANLIMFIFYALKDKELTTSLRSLRAQRSVLPLLFLLSIIMFHIAVCVSTMEPLNNLLPCSGEEIYAGQTLLTNGFLPYENFATRPLGPSVLIALLGSIIPNDLTYIYSYLGIFISVLIMLTLFLVVRHITKNDYISVLAAFLYSIRPDTFWFASSHVENVIFSAFLVLLLFLLYITDSRDMSNAKPILFCTTLLLYTRVENLILLLPLAIYLLRNLQRIRSKVGLWNCLLAYLFFIPSTVLISSVSIVLGPQGAGVPHSFGLANLLHRLASYIPVFNYAFSSFFIVFLVAGIVFCLFSRRFNRFALLVPLMMFLVYLFHQQYPEILMRYFFIIMPLLVSFIALGFFWLSTAIKSPLWKYGVVVLFLAAIIFSLPRPVQLSKFSPPITVSQAIGYSYFNGSRVVIFGPADSVALYHRYYNYTTSLSDIDNNLSQYDYLLFVSGDLTPLDYLRAYESTLRGLETKYQVKLELTDITNVSVTFRILKSRVLATGNHT